MTFQANATSLTISKQKCLFEFFSKYIKWSALVKQNFI